MANTSIFAAFERMWLHVVAALGNKSDSDHTHDDRYYTETEIDTKISTVNSSISDITSGATKVAKAETADTATSATSATTATTATKLGSSTVGSSSRPIYLSSGTATNITSVGTAYGGTGATTVAGARTNLGVYSTTEVDAALAGKSDTSHNHDEDYDALGSADTALASAKSYTDTKVSDLASTTVVDNKISTHNTSTSAHSDIRELISDLTTKLNNFLDVDDTTTDQLSEVLTLIENNKGTLESLTTSKINVSDIVNNLTTSSTSKVLSAAQGVAIKSLIDALQEELDSHTHAIADVSGLQSALDGKAATSHGTHVSYSSTAPVMDGTASVGTASTVARSDHKHPTDTSRAAQTDLDALETVVAGKADASHGHAISEITNLQAELDGKAASSHTHSYAGSSSVGGAATSANKVNSSLTVKLNGGTTEGTNMFTFNGSAAKSVNITPSGIGAAASSHTHDDRYYTETEIDSKLSGKANTSHGNHVPATQTASNNTFLRNDNTWATVTPANIGAAASSHTHTVANISDLTATATELNYMDGVTSDVQAQLDGKASSSHSHSAATTSAAGFMSSTDKAKLDGITASADSVSFSRSLTSGTKVGTITINGTGTDLYAPTNTDTHYTTGLKVGASASATANAAASNGSVYLNVLDNSTVRDSHKIVGSGATTVTSDANGVITISSTDNNTTYSAAGSSLGLVKSGGDVTISSGVITVNDDSHNHTIANIDNLQSTLDGKAASGHSHSAATTSADGFMSASDKSKLNGIASGANAYSLPTASSSTLGGVKTTSTVTSNSGYTACPIISGVPYYKDTNTTYSLSSFGVTATAAELNALDGITATVTELNYMDGVTANVQTQLNAKAASSHTHNYAGSSSAGGAATSANKLNTNAGDSNTPVYFSSGVPVACTSLDLNTSGSSASCTGNSATATTLATARTINGVSFNGSANITVPATFGITTAGTGAAYTATVSGITSLTTGASFIMIPNVVSTTTAPTLNVNSLGAKTIRRMVSNSTTSTAAGYNASWLAANKPIRVTYNGTYWIADITKPSAADMNGTLTVAKGGTGATTADNARTNLGAAAKWELVWENASPTSSFSAQTLTIDGLSDYNLFKVICRMSSDDDFLNTLSSEVYSGDGTQTFGVTGITTTSSGSYYVRLRYFNVTPSANTFEFNSGYYGYSGNTNTSSNGNCIPLYIFATKV